MNLTEGYGQFHLVIFYQILKAKTLAKPRTLFVKYLKFLCREKCLAVGLLCKGNALQKYVFFFTFSKTSRNEVRLFMLFKQCFNVWPGYNLQNIALKAKYSKLSARCVWKSSKAFFFLEASKKLFDEQCFATLPNRHYFAWKAKFKCLINYVLSLEDCLRLLFVCHYYHLYYHSLWKTASSIPILDLYVSF